MRAEHHASRVQVTLIMMARRDPLAPSTRVDEEKGRGATPLHRGGFI
jgi:hypothetical protein